MGALLILCSYLQSVRKRKLSTFVSFKVESIFSKVVAEFDNYIRCLNGSKLRPVCTWLVIMWVILDVHT